MMTVSVRDLRDSPLGPYPKPYLTWEEFLAMPKADPGLWDEIKAMREMETDWDDDPWDAAA